MAAQRLVLWLNYSRKVQEVVFNPRQSSCDAIAPLQMATSRITCLPCFYGGLLCPQAFTSLCSLWASLNFALWIAFEVVQWVRCAATILAMSPQMVCTGSILPSSLSKYIHTALLFGLLMVSARISLPHFSLILSSKTHHGIWWFLVGQWGLHQYHHLDTWCNWYRVVLYCSVDTGDSDTSIGKYRYFGISIAHHYGFGMCKSVHLCIAHVLGSSPGSIRMSLPNCPAYTFKPSPLLLFPPSSRKEQCFR